MNASIKQLLETVVFLGATDLYVTTGASPTIRFRGEIVKLNAEPLTSYSVEQMIIAILPDDQRLKFAREKSLEVTLNSPGIARFKLTLLIQQNRISMVVHRIVEEIELTGLKPAMAISNGGQFLAGSVAAAQEATMTVLESPLSAFPSKKDLMFADDDEKTHAMTPPPPRPSAYASAASEPDPWQTGMMKKQQAPVPQKKKRVA